MAGLLDFLQSASNTVAGNVSGPVDLLALALRKLGIEVPDNAVGSSQWMQERGLTRPVNQSAASLAGETAGLLAPIGVAAKAPEIARGLLKGAENLASPATLNPQTGAVVWHGSPHKFDKFDASKIGTGEGAQAYGHGLYLSESRNVADEYAGKLSSLFVDFADKTPLTAAEKRVAKIVSDAANGVTYGHSSIAANEAYRQVAAPSKDRLYGNSFVGQKPMTGRELAETLTLARAAQRLGKPSITDSGSLYKVDLPDEHIDKMLDWDKPLSEHQYRQITNKAISDFGSGVTSTTSTGEAAYKTIVDEMRRSGVPNPNQEAAAFLRSAGIPGVKYLDGVSRRAGEGSRNYVVFPGDEHLLQILERNGIQIR